jgi:hypothetical protein
MSMANPVGVSEPPAAVNYQLIRWNADNLQKNNISGFSVAASGAA